MARKSYNNIQDQWQRLRHEISNELNREGAKPNPDFERIGELEDRLMKVKHAANRYLTNIHNAKSTQNDFRKADELARKNPDDSFGGQSAFDRALDRKFSSNTYMGNNKG